jgi:hypothetical protein
MTAPTGSFLDGFKAAASEAEAAEGTYRRETAQRIALLERERAFAFRRLNLLRDIADAVAGSQSEEIAVASALAVLRGKLGWSSESGPHTEVLSRFAPVGQAVFRSLAPTGDVPVSSVQRALVEFEAWYEGNRPTAFWILFEHPMPETPRVDF